MTKILCFDKHDKGSLAEFLSLTNEVSFASNEAELLLKLSEGSYEIFIYEPKSALATIKKIEYLIKDIKTILHTGFIEKDLQNMGISGYDDYFWKPIDPQIILDKINN